MGKYRNNQLEKRIEEIKESIKINVSVAGVLKQLGLVVAGGNYNTIKNVIKKHDLDISHFTGKNHGKLPKWEGRPLKDILVENSTYVGSNSLKKRLLKEKLLTYQCANTECKINIWHNNPLVLQLDHINGVNDDHRLENLRLLCPNCHSQTATYCKKNVGFFTHINEVNASVHNLNETELEEAMSFVHDPSSNLPIRIGGQTQRKVKLPTRAKEYKCIVCDIDVTQGSTYCKKCYHNSIKGLDRPTVIDWPTKEELEKLVWEVPCSQLSLKLGVSDKAIEKHCKKFGILKPERGYWAKKLHGKL